MIRNGYNRRLTYVVAGIMIVGQSGANSENIKIPHASTAQSVRQELRRSEPELLLTVLERTAKSNVGPVPTGRTSNKFAARNRPYISKQFLRCSLMFLGRSQLLLAIRIQDPVEAASEELRKRNFPWYEREQKTIKEFDRKKPTQAKTIDRRDQPRTSLVPQRAPAAPLNLNPVWYSMFSGVAWTIIAIGFLAIVAVLVWVFLKMEGRSAENRQDSDDEAGTLEQRITQLPFELTNETRGDFRHLASDAARAGDYGRATMLLFSHVLIVLDGKGLIRLKKGKTNRQYLRELKANRAIAEYYKQIMVPFEENFFGSHSISKSVFEECWQQLDGFQSNVDEVAVPQT